MPDEALSLAIHGKALELGYDGCGILPLRDFGLDVYNERLVGRVGRFPESAAIYGPIRELFNNLRVLHPWAKSLVVCKFWMGRYRYPPALQGKYAKAFLLSPDTAPHSRAHRHKLEFGAWLERQGLRVLSDEVNAPVGIAPLRHAAVACGLGIFRKNNFFYDEKGSWHKLEAWLIDRKCEHRETPDVRPCPEKCSLCRRACPTGSLCEPFTMNPLICVSFLTTFGGGRVPPPLTDDALKDWICGCDACQDACPFNRRHDWQAGEPFDGLEQDVDLLQPRNILAASDETLREKVIPRTEGHLRPDQVGILRVCAARALRYEESRE